jgi:hypothetical protein
VAAYVGTRSTDQTRKHEQTHTARVDGRARRRSVSFDQAPPPRMTKSYEQPSTEKSREEIMSSLHDSLSSVPIGDPNQAVQQANEFCLPAIKEGASILDDNAADVLFAHFSKYAPPCLNEFQLYTLPHGIRFLFSSARARNTMFIRSFYCYYLKILCETFTKYAASVELQDESPVASGGPYSGIIFSGPQGNGKVRSISCV